MIRHLTAAAAEKSLPTIAHHKTARSLARPRLEGRWCHFVILLHHENGFWREKNLRRCHLRRNGSSRRDPEPVAKRAVPTELRWCCYDDDDGFICESFKTTLNSTHRVRTSFPTSSRRRPHQARRRRGGSGGGAGGDRATLLYFSSRPKTIFPFFLPAAVFPL